MQKMKWVLKNVKKSENAKRVFSLFGVTCFINPYDLNLAQTLAQV